MRYAFNDVAAVLLPAAEDHWPGGVAEELGPLGVLGLHLVHGEVAPVELQQVHAPLGEGLHVQRLVPLWQL